MKAFDIITFDVDDTLWDCERLYADAQAKIAKLLTPFGTSEEINAQLTQVEIGNVRLYGYGI
jgi:phosphoglycolate phosphatase-like HAD superfamily hydrolase